MDTLREINNRPIQECHHHEGIQSLEQRPKVKHQLDDNYWIHVVWEQGWHFYLWDDAQYLVAPWLILQLWSKAKPLPQYRP